MVNCGYFLYMATVLSSERTRDPLVTEIFLAERNQQKKLQGRNKHFINYKPKYSEKHKFVVNCGYFLLNFNGSKKTSEDLIKQFNQPSINNQIIQKNPGNG